ncbi:MAG: hypothetical protein Q4C70_15580, partial [Planctomycetia bacterium]|nr:hypothetical protein [Planctomycetia bacterium]
APADITAESATEAPVDRVPMEEVETETPESLDAALNAEVPEASTLPETVDMSEVPETPEVPVNESVLPELPELPEIPAESGTVPEVPEAVEIPEIPGELPEIPAEPSSEPMEELLPLEDVTPLETGKMMRPRQNVPGGARVLEVPRKGETATSSASSVEQDNKSKKSGSAIKFQKFSPEGPALELEIEDASHFGRNISPQKRMFMEPSGKKVVMSPLLQVNAEMKASKSVSKSASVQDSVQSSAQDSTQVSVPVATRWNISAETLRAAANIANNASKVDYGIRLTAAEMPVAVGNSAENNGNAGNNGNAVSKTPGEIVMQSDAAIAARLIERPSYAEPADEYIIDTKQPASRRDLGNAKKMKVGGAEVEDSWQADTQDQSGTFIYYNNAQGRSTVQSPDPVYIYAPRFRSVRQIVDLNVDSQVMTTGDIYTPEEIFIQGRNTGTDTAKQNAQTHTESGRTTLIQAQGAMGSGQVDGAIGVQSQNQEVVIAQENRTIVGPQASAGKARAVTASGLVEISAWTKTDGLQVFIEKESASAAVRNEFAPSLYTVKEGENKQDVRIYKVSSKTSAKPGETVDFIIYFENTGTAPVGNITLVDNLPARLEIVEDSAESSVDSSFTYEVNGTGSQTLRWEITQPLYAGEKGAVKFRALVR